MTNRSSIQRQSQLLCIAAFFAVSSAACSESINIKMYSTWGPGMTIPDTASKYDWAPKDKRPVADSRPPDTAVDKIISESIEYGFDAKGYALSRRGTPDFWIDYRVTKERRGDPEYGGPGFADFEEGSLVIYVLDPASGKVIWRGCAVARIDETIPMDVRRKRLDAGIKKMLGELPSAKAAR